MQFTWVNTFHPPIKSTGNQKGKNIHNTPAPQYLNKQISRRVTERHNVWLLLCIWSRKTYKAGDTSLWIKLKRQPSSPSCTFITYLLLLHTEPSHTTHVQRPCFRDYPSEPIAYASLHLAPDSQIGQHPTTQFFTGRMPFLPLNQQRQSTEGKTAYWT